MYQNSLFVFRRDLRLSDNTALNNAFEQSKKVTLLFLIDPQQVGRDNDYRSLNAMQFMQEALIDLDKQCSNKLNFLYGDPEKIVEFATQENIEALFINKDYTPFSLQRDAKLEKLCLKNKINFHSYDDLCLNSPESILTGQKKPYSIYTPYYKSASIVPLPKPKTVSGTVTSKKIDLTTKEWEKIFSYKNPDLFVNGTQTELENLLKRIKTIKNYQKERDYPALDQTTHLSAYLKFGLISARQLYWHLHKLDPNHPIIKQLYWRDFYTQVLYYNPQVYKGAYHSKYNNLKWDNNKKNFLAWCNGETGFPIVDAGMRQLNKTGYMHNRVRMIVASFLVKDLHINWQWGEKYFAQQLVDYDPALNNGNWQWAASTGCDAVPYFRIFNPWLQQKKFDPKCEYIKKWIPELKELTPNEIHKYDNLKISVYNYPKPIVDHKKQAELAKKMFKNI